MKILVANLGSTSFKYRLFNLAESEEAVAKGGYERVEDFGAVIEDALGQLVESGHLSDPNDLDGVGFKTVLGKHLSGCVLADERTLAALDGFSQIAPAHNPAYANGIRQFSRLTEAPLVALFETSFYQWMPEAFVRYGVPEAWHAAGIRRYGFHGASHKFIAERSAELMGNEAVAERVRRLYVNGPGPEPEGQPLRVISCHLGGSSSVTGMVNGVAVATSMGLSPQAGLPQNNRVGDLDSMAIPVAMNELGIDMDEAVRQLTKEGGLLGISGVSNDIRDISAAADSGNKRAQLAMDCLISHTRSWMGNLAFQMGGVDAIVFTAGIGQNQVSVREGICAGLEDFGVRLDREKNANCGGDECDLTAEGGRVRILIIPTNEELVVAREARRLIETLQKP